jgi:hypothetical protein
MKSSLENIPVVCKRIHEGEANGAPNGVKERDKVGKIVVIGYNSGASRVAAVR